MWLCNMYSTYHTKFLAPQIHIATNDSGFKQTPPNQQGSYADIYIFKEVIFRLCHAQYTLVLNLTNTII